MARPQYKSDYIKGYTNYTTAHGTKYTTNIRPALVRHKKTTKRKANPIAFLLNIVLLAVFVVYVVPVYYNQVTRPLLTRTNKYPLVKADLAQIAYPTSNYLHNSHILGMNFLQGTQSNKPQMQKLYETYHLTLLESKLNNLAAAYPSLKPSIYVWDYESGKHADLRSNEVYATASIIKIPVLIQLFRSIDAGSIKLNDKIAMTDYYKSEGSGSLQFKGSRTVYTVDDLARVMITESDNSATNMLLSATGGMNAMNRSLRKWGMKETRINDWLPDLAGTNVTTAKEMATLLYNIDNTNFLSLKSREKMIDYMGHVHNNRLIQAGLPKEAIFIHKTGDIGKMLGDAGVVFTPNGKRYIVVMLVNRPYNSPQGKDFIVAASSLIYNFMTYTNL